MNTEIKFVAQLQEVKQEIKTIADLKSEIKLLASQQVELKNQRKTVHIQGERKMEPWKATISHLNNREKLRIMYMTYGLLRGKTQEQIESNPKTPINMDLVKKLMLVYPPVIQP